MQRLFDIVFRFMMGVLCVIVIAGTIAAIAWKLAAFLAVIIILSPFALVIYMFIVRKLKKSSTA